MTHDDDPLIQLLQTYGAEPARWPDHARAAGRALLQQNPATLPPAVRAALAEAVALDGALAAHRVAPPDAALAARIAALAPVREAAARPMARPVRAGGWLPAGWPGLAGLGMVGAAGALAGAFAVSIALNAATLRGDAQDRWLDGVDAFGLHQSQHWSEE